MATIVLQAAGAALGSFLGGPIGGALGRAAGAYAGSAFDQKLFGPGDTDRAYEGPRLEASQFLGSREGAVLPQLYGRARLSGQLIWATRFEEEQIVERETAGGKGAPKQTATRTTYAYFANFALALCEGEVAHIGRIWVDGQEIEPGEHAIRLHKGTRDQEPDALIAAKQPNGTPAYRGTAYLVFERFALEAYGNRIPQITVEAVRPLGGWSDVVRAVNVIPGAGEFAYDPEPVVALEGDVLVPLNRHVKTAATDWAASMDELQALCPRLERVALVVSWFGDDLRAGRCSIAPRVEVRERVIDEGEGWSVAGLDRSDARPTTYVDGRPAYGGTPSDGSVVRALHDLRKRGLLVTFNPFVMMDIGPGNGLPDPHGGAEQAAFPWRGRIVCDDADRDVATFATDYRAFVLHCAGLCAEAGGVDTFLLGSEMRGLTRARGADGFPFMEFLRGLAHEVRAILPNATITYAADWSEYGALVEGGDVSFPLDALWADNAIGCVAIDNYMPMSDWRAEPLRGEGRHPNDRAALQASVAGGEDFDWYYASEAEREAGVRTPITDGLGEPWMYRTKDLAGWWSNRHVERREGVRTEPTAWLPGSKPVRFNELGCGAIDVGPNQPNVFHDPKSAESALPRFSTGARDDEAPLAFAEAHAAHWDAQTDGMVDPAHTHLWAWDARPWPAFPRRRDVWSDGDNWYRGHWLNGRVGTVTVRDLLAGILLAAGIENVDVKRVHGTVDGYVLAQDTGPRAAVEALLALYRIDAFERAGTLVFRTRGRDAVIELDDADLVVTGNGPVVARERAQASDLPVEAVLDHVDPDRDYQGALARSRRLTQGRTSRTMLSLPVVMDATRASKLVDDWVHSTWGERETILFALARDHAALGVGARVRLDRQVWRVVSIEEGDVRSVSAVREPAERRTGPVDLTPSVAVAPQAASVPVLCLLDLPLLDTIGGTNANRVAVGARIWGGPYALREVRADGSSAFVQNVEQRATMGRLVSALGPGAPWRWSGEAFEVQLLSGRLASRERRAVLDGANVCAVSRADGAWEVLQFERAELVADRRYRLSGLLRGQGGTEPLASVPAGEGERFVLLDEAVRPLAREPLRFGDAIALRLGENRDVDAVPGSRGFAPLAPVHARFEGGVLRWTRRDRALGADLWTLDSVPMSEADERYQVTIADRSWEVREPRFAVPSDADPNAPASVAQISAVVGNGDPLDFTLAGVAS